MITLSNLTATATPVANAPDSPPRLTIIIAPAKGVTMTVALLPEGIRFTRRDGPPASCFVPMAELFALMGKAEPLMLQPVVVAPEP